MQLIFLPTHIVRNWLHCIWIRAVTPEKCRARDIPCDVHHYTLLACIGLLSTFTSLLGVVLLDWWRAFPRIVLFPHDRLGFFTNHREKDAASISPQKNSLHFRVVEFVWSDFHLLSNFVFQCSKLSGALCYMCPGIYPGMPDRLAC